MKYELPHINLRLESSESDFLTDTSQETIPVLSTNRVEFCAEKIRLGEEQAQHLLCLARTKQAETTESNHKHNVVTVASRLPNHEFTALQVLHAMGSPRIGDNGEKSKHLAHSLHRNEAGEFTFTTQ